MWTVMRACAGRQRQRGGSAGAWAGGPRIWGRAGPAGVAARLGGNTPAERRRMETRRVHQRIPIRQHRSKLEGSRALRPQRFNAAVDAGGEAESGAKVVTSFGCASARECARLRQAKAHIAAAAAADANARHPNQKRQRKNTGGNRHPERGIADCAGAQAHCACCQDSGWSRAWLESTCTESTAHAYLASIKWHWQYSPPESRTARIGHQINATQTNY
jgi:hypothetical protein